MPSGRWCTPRAQDCHPRPHGADPSTAAEAPDRDSLRSDEAFRPRISRSLWRRQRRSTAHDPLGLTHKQAEASLHAHQFCLDSHGELPKPEEMYPRCDRTASELGDAWVTAKFEGDRLVELRRWERYGDDDHAVARWNELVGARSKTSTPSDEALHALEEHGLAEPGTKTVKAFRDPDGTVVGVYL